MQDLNDKVTGNLVTAAEWNQMPSELQNLIEGVGQTLSGADLLQLSKAAAAYAAGGDFYAASGTNTVALAAVGSKSVPHAYFNGMRVRFRPANESTGAVTVAVGALAAKALRLEDDSALVGGELNVGVEAEAVYHLSTDRFRLVGGSGAWTRAQRFKPLALTSGAAVAWDMEAAQYATLSLAHNATISAPSKVRAGGQYTLYVAQTGAFTLAFNAAFAFLGATPPTIGAVAGDKLIISFSSPDGTLLIYTGHNQD